VQPVLFSKIILNDFEKASENLRHLMVNSNRLGTYVKALEGKSNLRKTTSFITMDFLFPNLDKMDLY
jgi:hypothetical protein